MPEFIEVLNFQPPIVKYDSMEMSYGIAERCKTCNSRILHHESISVCGCYRYCHQKCTILQLSAKNKQREQLMYECKQCNKKLGVNYNMETYCKPHINKENVFLILVPLLLIPLAVYGLVMNQRSFLAVFTLSFLIFVLLCFFACGIINSILVR